MPVPPKIEPDFDDDALFWATGRVRGIFVGETAQHTEYARIRLAGSRDYFMDFDSPDDWSALRGSEVRILFDESVGADGFKYWRVLNVEALDD